MKALQIISNLESMGASKVPDLEPKFEGASFEALIMVPIKR